MDSGLKPKNDFSFFYLEVDPHAPNSNSLIVTNESKWLGWAPLEGAWIFGLYMHISYEESSELDSDDAKKRKKKKSIPSHAVSQSVSQSTSAGFQPARFSVPDPSGSFSVSIRKMLLGRGIVSFVSLSPGVSAS